MEELNIKSEHHYEHLMGMMSSFRTSQLYTDVTLVTDDKTSFNVHKIVVTAFSKVFKDILGNNQSQNNSIVYLKGVKSSVLSSILDFIYLGQVSIKQDMINDFLETGKSLEVKELMSDPNDFQCFLETEKPLEIKGLRNIPTELQNDMKLETQQCLISREDDT